MKLYSKSITFVARDLGSEVLNGLKVHLKDEGFVIGEEFLQIANSIIFRTGMSYVGRTLILSA